MVPPLRKFMRALPKSATRWLGVAAPALVAWSLTSGIAQAAAPAAGTIISNQAAASTDGQGIDRVSQSNAVETLVLPRPRSAWPATTPSRPRPAHRVLSHALTNTGNAADQFKITVDKPANTVGSPASTCDIYIDEDGNGLPDSNTSIGTCGKPFNTASVQAGGVYRFVIGATVTARPPRATKPRSPSTPRASMIRPRPARRKRTPTRCKSPTARRST